MAGNVVYQKGRFKVIKTSSDFLVRNNELDYSHHSHFHKLGCAKKCIQLIDQRVLPQSEYVKESIRRLITEEEFDQLRQDKKRTYYNVQGGKALKYKR